MSIRGAAQYMVQYMVHAVVHAVVHGVVHGITATPMPPGACPCDASERCVLSCGARELATS